MAGKRRKKRRGWLWLALVLAVAVAVFVMRRSEDGTIYQETTLSKGDISTTYSFTGSVAATRVQTAVASAAGKVMEVYVEGNQRVRSGDRLLGLAGGEIIRAEMDGEVAQLNVAKDDLVAAGTVLAVILDADRLEAQILVDEYDIGAVELGREASVTVNALEETRPGVLTRYDKQPTLHGTVTAYTAYVDFDAPEKALPGMQVEVKIPNQFVEGATLLRMEALQFDEKNRAYVLVKNGEDGYEPAYLETGISDGVYVEILSGAKEGDTVYYPSADPFAAMMTMRGGRGR